MMSLKNYSIGSFWSHEVFVSFFRKKRKGDSSFFREKRKEINRKFIPLHKRDHRSPTATHPKIEYEISYRHHSHFVCIPGFGPGNFYQGYRTYHL